MAKLLLVEDDNNLREIYEARLQAEGYEIVSAKDGEEALAVAKAEKPDLVISDIMMPKISGFEMLDILRNTNDLKNIKVIMLTALGQNDDQQRADKLGADRYLVKSQVTLEDIVRAAHDLLGDVPPKIAGEPEAAAVQTNTSPEPVKEAPVETVSEPSQPEATDSAKPEPPVEPAPAEPEQSATPHSPPAQDNQVTDQVAPLIEPLEPEQKPPAPADGDVQAAPAPSPEPPSSDPPPEPSATDTPAETASQETSEVESQIEDFVSGATTEASAPSPSDATS